MSQPEEKKRLSSLEYFEGEIAEYKSEYYHGEIFAMSGASFNHNVISINIGSMVIRVENKLIINQCLIADIRISDTGFYDPHSVP